MHKCLNCFHPCHVEADSCKMGFVVEDRWFPCQCGECRCECCDLVREVADFDL